MDTRPPAVAVTSVEECVKRFDVITATFRPRRSDDLRYNSAEFVGREMQWQAAWLIEDGPYKNEWAMTPYKYTGNPQPHFAWVPSGDLELRDAASSDEGRKK